jgi:hypothetical protein
MVRIRFSPAASQQRTWTFAAAETRRLACERLIRGAMIDKLLISREGLRVRIRFPPARIPVRTRFSAAVRTPGTTNNQRALCGAAATRFDFHQTTWGPNEGFGAGIVLGEISINGGLQIDDRAEHTAADALPRCHNCIEKADRG